MIKLQDIPKDYGYCFETPDTPATHITQNAPPELHPAGHCIVFHRPGLCPEECFRS